MQCDKCNSDTICYGKTKEGKQRYRCKKCFSIQIENSKFKWLSNEEKKIISELFNEGKSIQHIMETLHRQYNTIYSFLKKKKRI